jgi:hypothetical protein
VNAVMNLLTFGFHKMLRNYRVAAQLVASRVVLSSTELVIIKLNSLCTLNVSAINFLETYVVRITMKQIMVKL